MEQDIVVSPPSAWDARTLRGLLDICGEDRAVNGRSPFHPASQALIVHRLGEWLAHPGRNRLVARVGGFVQHAAAAYVRNYIGYEISPGAKIGRRVHFAHQHGIVIAPETEIGDDALILHEVTVGLRMDAQGGTPEAGARIGARVRIGTGARILGAVRIGDGANIGPNAVVMTDVPENASVIAAPSRVLRLRSADDRDAS
ncbi:serine O-acetyltransferase [Propionicicella superfundia]|uniref:serine O-acetyltransferase n=1 Tax=Propionicicella superfundia TaxID=348582 RepID=UPI00040E132D|nr:hypothetical protein [Propionicicella superfundia]